MQNREFKHKLSSKLSIATFLGGVVVSILLNLFFDSLMQPKPEAIDVYRGNTEIEITEVVKNSIVVSRDTIVKFK